MTKVKANDWKQQEKMMREYFMADVEVKITGETNEDYTVEFTIDMEGLYLKTSFIAVKERINNWEKEQNLKPL